MQNLRDKLLKAGLVTNKQAEKAEEELKRKPVPPRSAPREHPAARPSPAHLSIEEQQSREAFALHEAERTEQRRRDAAKAAEAKSQSERARSIRALIQEHRIVEAPGEVAFHFVRRSGKVGRLALTPETAKLLEEGAAAVVEQPGQPDPAVLPGAAAAQIWRIDPRAIFFWAGPQKPIGFDDLPAATEES